MKRDLVSDVTAYFAELDGLDLESRVEAINRIRLALSAYSPFKAEPVDCVQWIKAGEVQSNDYNPNSVAPPEMELLRLSIAADGYTQPIVAMKDGEAFTVIDGFHRNRVGKECADVRERVQGYLPVVQIRSEREDRSDRIASTIRHNRARGKHQVSAMADIVTELKKRNWSHQKIAKELGMDDDEVLRLCQITGLTELFSNETFSQAWDAVIMSDDELVTLDDGDVIEPEDSGRIFHEWQKWECYPAGFYSDKPPQGMTVEDCEVAYRDFLRDLPRFDQALTRVLKEWPTSAEHYLTNERMNRIAWLGQSSMCIETGVPSRFCGGYNMLDESERTAADLKALEHLNLWLAGRGKSMVDLEGAGVKASVNLY
jgi:ParB-like chromosome segregation protein Spo0J